MRKNYFIILSLLIINLFSYGQTSFPIEPGPVNPADAIVSINPFSEKPVGKTEGNLDVTLTGSAIFNVPIKVPEGVNGTVPVVSLQYNSQSGNGIVGLGWSISGVSSISRIPSTLFHDGKISAVNFSKDDRFALDGQRLLLKSGVYGGDGAEYQTENYSNVRITSHGISPYGASYGPKYFKVENPDGSIAMYGHSDNSRSKMSFGITNWKNASGVHVVYNYVESGGLILISSIKYVNRIRNYELEVQDSNFNQISSPAPNTKASIFPPIKPRNSYDNEVVFHYASGYRRVKDQGYVGGETFNNSELLVGVESKSSDKVFRKYNLNYEYTFLGYNRLVEISEFAENDKQGLAPLKFSYKDSSEHNYEPYKSAIDNGLSGDITTFSHDAITGDFDNDGVLDYILYNKNKREYWVSYSTNPQEGKYIYRNLNKEYFNAIFPMQLKNNDGVILPYEGWLEIIENQFIVKSLKDGVIRDEFSKTYTFPKFEIEVATKNCKYKEQLTIPKQYFSGDFNGDGLTDILVIETPFSYSMPACFDQIGFDEDKPFYDGKFLGGMAYLLNINESTSSSPIEIGYFPIGLTHNHILTGNFLGSGKTDVLIKEKGRFSVRTLNNNYFTTVVDYYNPKITLDSQMHIGDFNGDGKTDIMLSPESGVSVIFYSTGTSFQEEDQQYSFRNTMTRKTESYNVIYNWWDYATYIAVDFNNDGKTDIVNFNYIIRPEKHEHKDLVFPKEGQFSDIYSFKNNGHGFIRSQTTNIDKTHTIIDAKSGNIQFNPIPIVQTPDRQFSFIRDNFQMAFIINNKIYKYNYRHNSNLDKQLLKIDNGDGTSYHIRYEDYGVESIVKNPLMPHYLRFDKNLVKYPSIEMMTMPNTQVVAQLTLSDGVNGLNRIFSYASPIFDFQGLGFLGFKGMVSTNWYDKEENMYKSIKEFDVTNRGVLTKESVIHGSNWNSFVNTNNGGGFSRVKPYQTITTFENSSQLLPNKVFKTQVKKAVFKNLAGLSIGGQFIKEVENIYNSYNDITKQTSVHKFRSPFWGQADRIDKTEVIDNVYLYGVNSEKYFMSRLAISKTTKKAPNVTDFISEDRFVYDDVGRITEAVKTGHDSGSVTEKNTYDINGNIIEKIIQAGNLAPRVTKYKYGFSGRFLTETTDVSGLKTLYSYNASKGLLIEETNHFGQKKFYEYNNWGQQVSETNYLGKTTKTQYHKRGNNVEITTTDEQGLWSKECFDPYGNKIKTSVKNLSGELVHKNFKYNAFNQVIGESESYFGTQPSLWMTIDYDSKGRVSKTLDSKGKETKITYSLDGAVVKDGVNTKEEVVNAVGEVIMRKDNGGTITYKYFSNGSLKSTSYEGVEIEMEQDGWGRKTKLTDPSAGVYSYEYNALGELIKEVTPKGSTSYTIDDVGRVVKMKIVGDETNNEIDYVFDPNNQLLTSSQAIVNGENFSYALEYDAHNRLISTSEMTPSATFSKTMSYDEFGREEQVAFKAVAYGGNSETKIKNTYKNGYHWQVVDAVTNKVLTEKLAVNEFDLVTQFNLGNGLKLHNKYDVYGYITENVVKKNEGNLFSLTNTFDIKRGLLLSRTNSLFNHKEHFTYDALDRLVSFTNKVGHEEIQYYDTKGRVEENDLGVYEYSNTNSYQLRTIDLKAEAQPYYQLRPEQRVVYNAFKSPVSIKEKGLENVYFTYNANNQRSFMYYGNEGLDKTQSTFIRHYSADGAMEATYDVVANKIDFLTFIDGDAYGATVISKGTTSQEYFYLHRDYLGSILAISDQLGEIVEKRHFDAWGNLVFVKDKQNTDLEKLTFLDRGYTGHEHVQGVALIHMNARLYDPVIRRFLAPDNFVQDPTNTQNFNRYSYVLNNPLCYVDENGEFWVVAIGAVVGAYLGGSMHQDSFNPKDWGSDWWKGAAVGAVLGAYGGYQLSAVIGMGGISTHTVFATSLVTVGKSMIQSYMSGIASVDADSGFVLNFSLNKGRMNQMLMKGIIAGTNGLIDMGLNEIIKGEQYKVLLRNPLKDVASNVIKGDPAFKKFGIIKMGNGVINIGVGHKLIDASNFKNHALGFLSYGLASALGEGEMPRFNRIGLNFKFNNNRDFVKNKIGNWWENMGSSDKIAAIGMAGVFAGIVSTLGVTVK